MYVGTRLSARSDVYTLADKGSGAEDRVSADVSSSSAVGNPEEAFTNSDRRIRYQPSCRILHSVFSLLSTYVRAVTERAPRVSMNHEISVSVKCTISYSLHGDQATLPLILEDLRVPFSRLVFMPLACDFVLL